MEKRIALAAEYSSLTEGFGTGQGAFVTGTFLSISGSVSVPSSVNLFYLIYLGMITWPLLCR